MSTILTIAAKEVRDGLRNRWVAATTLLMAALALTLTFLGAAPTGTVGVGQVEVTIVSLSSLTIFLLPLLALLLSFDAIVGEIDRGTMLLLLSYPVARWQALLGKFLGHLAIIAFATLCGYGCAGAALWATVPAIGPQSWAAFAAMLGSSVLLGGVFVSLGYLASTLVRDRGTAAGIAVALWLVFVLLYDMGLLGLLVATQGQGLGTGLLNALLLANPADAYRLFNLAGFAEVGRYAGMAGLAAHGTLAPGLLLLALAGWLLLPLGLSALILSRRQI
ncbi:ABC transporter permease [Oleisolibacter albus]|uniref:ABC transporter permease n=1 Tax=Oleisolibacter albus TaxID=2171757 RepID=UPI000DF4B8BD|nr:ABC transporter permease subunit [Oleisolibacter albus]